MELGTEAGSDSYRGDLEALDVDNTDLATDDIQVISTLTVVSHILTSRVLHIHKCMLT